MWYDSKKPIDVQNAIEKIKHFILHQKVFELTEKHPPRSISQNSYLHLLISIYALEYGESAKYIKEEFFKKEVNRDLFFFVYTNRKTGEIRDEWKSTKDLNTAEMTMAIERFRNYVMKQSGFYLPTPAEHLIVQAMQLEVANNRMYL